VWSVGDSTSVGWAFGCSTSSVSMEAVGLSGIVLLGVEDGAT
jgi:hypothetical protein